MIFRSVMEALTRVCENAICEHIRRAGSLEGVSFNLNIQRPCYPQYGLCFGSCWRYISALIEKDRIYLLQLIFREEKQYEG